MPLVTPVSDQGAVSDADVAALVGPLTPYVDVLMPALSTGEGAALDDAQWHDMIGSTVRHAADWPVVAGILRATTDEVVARAAVAARLGAAGVAVATPFGAAVTQRQMYEHYARLTADVALPIVVYDESAVSGNTLDIATAGRISTLPGVVAVKDSTGDPARPAALAGAGASVWLGMEHLAGACGPVDGLAFGLANVEPALCAALWHDGGEPVVRVVSAARESYGLLGDDWYLRIKAALQRRGVISTARPVAEANPVR